jgi:hypothetical protein
MTMYPTPNREGLSTRTLAIFLVLGIALVVIGATDFADGWGFVVVGSVVGISNGLALYRRRSSGN